MSGFPESPPLALERLAGASRLIERVELCHVLVGEREVEDPRVLLDALSVSRLGDHRNAVLHAPAQQHLRRRAPGALSDPVDGLVGHVATGAERAVCLERDVAPPAGVEQRGIAIEAYSPLGTGRHLGDPRVAEIAGRVGRTPAQVLLRWCLQRGLIVISKSVHRERIEENARIFDFSLADEDMRALDALDETGGTDRAREQKWW